MSKAPIKLTNENDELIKTVKTQGSTKTTTETVITLTGNKTEVTEGQVTYRAAYDDFNRIKTYYDGTYHFTYAYECDNIGLNQKTLI